MNILIVGKGQIAQAYQEYFAKTKHSAHVAGEVDITQKAEVAAALKAHGASVVINTAAKTNLDWCEINKTECFAVNTLGADTVAGVCQERGVMLVHISTGCIQESKTAAEAHKETDPANPVSFYSWSKYWADQMLLVRKERGLKVLILRPRQPISAKASARNALVKMLTYTKFIDTPNSMTVIEDFVEVTDALLQKGATGLYNVANPGVMTPLRLAELLKEYVHPEMVVSKISKEELNAMTYAMRIDSVLDTSKLEGEHIQLKDIETRAKELLQDFKANLEKAPEVLQKTITETKEKLALAHKKNTLI